jgi:conjugative relaxase-like TrwC/TraI family protein
MVLKFSTGHSTDYLLSEVGEGLDAAERGASAYYTGAETSGEPPGLWWGAGAAALGLSGVVDAETMQGLFDHRLDPRDPAARSMSTWGEAATLTASPRPRATRVKQAYEQLLAEHPGAGPEQRVALRAQADRQVAADNRVAFDDLTYSPPKSVTVAWAAASRAGVDARAGAQAARQAGDFARAAAQDAHAAEWAGRASGIEQALLTAHRAALSYLEDNHCFVRAGKHGRNKATGESTGKWLDGKGLTAAQFLQHDSRDRDPQLHVHGPVLNAAEGSDGKWRGLDRATLKSGKWAASAIADRVLEAELGLLGMHCETRPDGIAREIVGVAEESRDVFSSRRHKITPATEKLIGEFREREGREPTGPERERLSEMATLATRARKYKGPAETQDETLDRWAAKHHAGVGSTLRQVAELVFTGRPVAPARWSQRDVIQRALAAVSEERQSWTRADLTGKLSEQLPANLGVAPGQVRPLLEGLADRALEQAVRLSPVRDNRHLPAELRRTDGASVHSAPAPVQYATKDQLAGERTLREAAVRRGAPAMTAAGAERAIAGYEARNGMRLDEGQAAALRGILTSGAILQVVAAPAGTGKSVLDGALAQIWTAGKVRGIAFGQRQADVLTAEGVTSRNIAHWLVGQRRLAADRPVDDDAAFRLSKGDLIMVDEAQLAGTPNLVEIEQRVRAAGAALVLTGDTAQGGMGPSGMLGDLTGRALTYQLAEVHRFTDKWEGPASLGLRDGDVTALGEYDKNGRIRDGGSREECEAGAARLWLADAIRGKESLVLTVSNAAAARISAQLRAELISLGRVQESGVPLDVTDRHAAKGTFAGVGDLVQARHANRQLGLVNRAMFRVQKVGEDDSLEVVPVSYDRDTGEQLGAPRVIPADYVRDHVTLGYASTEAAAIGRNVHGGYPVLEAGMSRSGAYVMSTRGRETNIMFVVTQHAGKDAAPGETAEAVRRDALGVLTDIFTRPPDSLDTSALGQLEQAEAAAQALPAALDPLLSTLSDLTDARTGQLLDRQVAAGIITGEERAAFVTDPATRSLSQLLRTAELAGHDPAQVLTAALEPQSLHGSTSVAQVTHARVANLLGDLAPQVTSFRDLIPAIVDVAYRPALVQWTDAADARRHALGAEAAADPPDWAASLGPVPTDPLARVDWETRAGWAAAYREMTAAVAPLAETDPLGAAPPGGLVEKRSMWETAHRALALVDGGAAEEKMTEGKLRGRVHAYERERNWAPPYVAEQLGATHDALHRAQTDATIWTARAQATTDPEERTQLAAAAAQARAAADRYTAMIPDLETTDDARARWFAHTAATRDAATRADAALRIRGIDINTPDDRVTAEEWLAEHLAERADSEPARNITDADVPTHEDVHENTATHVHTPAEPVGEMADDDAGGQAHDGAETDVPDIRQWSVPDAGEHTDPGTRRVPLVDKTAAAVERAETAAREIDAREAWESNQPDTDEADPAARAVDEPEVQRSATLNRYAADDAANTESVDDEADSASSSEHQAYAEASAGDE